jgi:LPS-assembly protein
MQKTEMRPCPVWIAVLDRRHRKSPMRPHLPRLACPRRAAFAPRVSRRIVFLFALGLVCFVRAFAQTGQITYHADIGDVDIETGEWIGKGNARFRDDAEGVLLTADEMRYNAKTQVATTSGHVVLTRGGARLLADRLVYNKADGTFVAESIRLGSHPLFIEGFSASGTRTQITVERARVSYGEPGPWQPTFNADRVVYGPGKSFRTENSQFGIGSAQPFPFPRFQHDFAQPFALDVSLTGGFRASLGAFVDADLHVPVRPGLWLGAAVGVFTERGVMAGPSGRYRSAGEKEKMRGYFRSGYINDHGDKKTDLLGRPVPEERGYVEWQHQQSLAENLTLTAQLNWWKDSEVVRDFRPRTFFPVQQPDTFVESVYTGENYFVSAFARLQPNSFHRVQERLPEIRFDLLPVALGNGFYHRFNASAAVLREDPVMAGPVLRSDRLDGYYAMSRPFASHEWLSITPMAGGRITHYANTRGALRSGNYTRLLGEIGVDAALRGSATFAYKNERWKIDGLRHLVTPHVSYRYIPERDRGNTAQIPAIDREVFSTYLQPLGLAHARNIDDLRALNTLRFGIDNVVQTRDPVHGTRDLLLLNVANDFRFKRRPGERDVSEIHTELALMPVRWLQVDVYQSFAPQSFTLREFNSGVTLRDGNVWSVRFSNNFLRHQLQDYLVDGRFRINEAFEALTRLHYDVRRRRFNEQSYGIVHNLSNTWLISYTVSIYSGRRRESSFGFNVQIDTVRF